MNRQRDPLSVGVADAIASLGEIADGGIRVPMPPGAQPVPWLEQVARFTEVLPGLVMGGPAAQQIDAEHGAGAAQAYMDSMMAEIVGGRQRRG